MAERSAATEAFLAAHGFAGAVRRRLAGDASARRYERIAGPRPAILMDCPPERLDVAPFLHVQAALARLGLSVPEVLAADRAHGLVLLEDLGDQSFSRLLAAGGDQHGLYAAAVDLLVDLQREAPTEGLPPYDDARLMAELEVFLGHAVPGLAADAADAFRSLWKALLPASRTGPEAFVYVDYHADNLQWLGEREGRARIGLLDFQDARVGPPAYDLVSLLEDARRDVPPDLAAAMIERYLGRRPELDPARFAAAYAILGAQRNSKILGLFRRLAVEDGKRRYLDLLPRVEAHLRRDLAHPALAPLRPWYRTHLFGD
ncbi:MAG TPA: phosphotransferase [Geminicoccaceae bacterium]